jgi:O-antigen ligase
MGYCLALLYISLLYLSIGDMFPAIAPFRPNLVLVFLAAVASVPIVLRRHDYFRMPEFMLLCGFIGAIFFSVLVKGWFGGVLLSSERFMPAAVTFFLMAANCTSTARVKWTLRILLVIALGLVIKGAMELDSGRLPNPWVMEQKFWSDRHMSGEIITLLRIRALGILNDPNDFAQFLIISVPICWLAWKRGAKLRNLVLVIAPASLLLYGVFLTRSRGSLVGLVVVTAALLYRRFGRIASVVGPALLLAALLAVGFSGGRALSYAGGMDRIMLWSDGLGMFKSSPLWGVSWGAYTDYTRLTAHNSFVLCFAELGLIGYFFFIGIIVVGILRVNRLADNPALDPDIRRTASVLMYVLYAFVSSSWFLTRTYEATLYLLVGLVAALELNYREETPPARLDPDPGPPLWLRRTLMTVFASIAAVYVMVRARGL